MRKPIFSLFVLFTGILFGQVQTLNFQPVRAGYSATLDRIVFTSTAPNQLHVYDPAGPTVQSIALPELPLSLAVLNGRAAVRFSNSIQLINLSPLSVANTFPNTPLFSSLNQGLVLGPEWIHVGGLQSIRISNGQVVSVPGGVELSRTERVPDNTGFMGLDYNGGLFRYDISTGPITSRSAVPIATAAFSVGQSTGRFYASSGYVYATDTPTGQPEYYGELEDARVNDSLVSGAAESPSSPYTVVIQGQARRLAVYQRGLYQRAAIQQLSAGNPIWVSFNNNGDRIYTLLATGTSYTLEVSNWTSQQPCTLSFSSPPNAILRDGGLYRNGVTAAPDCRYTVQSSANWIRMVSGAQAGGDTEFSFFAEPNRTGQSRSTTITAGTQSMTVTQAASSADPGHRFGFTVIAEKYNKANDTLPVASPQLNFLPIYNPATRQYKIEPLPLRAFAIGLQPNGDYAAVGHGGAISIVKLNPSAPSVPTLKVPLHVKGVALPGNGYVYAYGEDDARGLYWRNLTSGQSGFVAAPAAYSMPLLHVPARNALYWQGAKWSITNGIPVRVDRMSSCGGIWTANDAGTLTFGCGKAYIASDVATEDGLDAGSLVDGWADYSGTQQAIAIVNESTNQVQVWNESPLALRGAVAIPSASETAIGSRGSKVFWSANGSKMYATVLEPGGASLLGDGIVEMTPPLACTYTLSPVSLAADYSGDTEQLTVTTQAGCTWTATLSGGSWSSLTNASGTGNGTVTINVAPNTDDLVRRVTIQVGSARVTLTQASNPGTITVSPQIFDVPAGASSPTLTITASNAAVGWRVRAGSSFFSVNGTVGNGSAQLPVIISANTGGSRIASFLVNDVAVVIRQAAATAESVTFTGTGTVLPGSGGSAQITLNANGGWTATSNASWLRITSAASGSGNGSITVTAPPNPSRDFRTATIVAGGSAYTVMQAGQQPLEFFPLTPCRIADTRNAPGPLGQPFLAAQTERTFPVRSSSCGIPAEAVAYSLNVTVVPLGALGYLTVHPAGEARPVISLLNSLDGRIKANSTILRAGTSGGITAFATGNTHVVLDINGYFAPPRENGLRFRPVTPCRVVDTRNPAGPRGGPALLAGLARTITVAGTCAVPTTARAYALNVTALPRQTLGYISVWPTGQSQPTVSTLNAVTGTITANAALTPAGTNGAIQVFANNDTDLLVDVNGYFEAATEGTSVFPYYTINPCRIADTRVSGEGPAMQASETRFFEANTVACQVPIGAVNLTLNATVIPQGPFGYLTLWDPFSGMPVVSTLNAVDGALTSNGAFVPTGVIPSTFRAFTSSPADLLFDVTGYFAN